jgi:hypothetical protein
MEIADQKSKIKNGSWLPDMDLNHDKQIQSLLCYRYTIGQAGALGRLKGFPSQSSRRSAGYAAIRVLVCCICSAMVFPIWALAADSVLSRVEQKLRPVLENLQPSPTFEYPQSSTSLIITFRPQGFQVHSRSRSGEWLTNVTEKVGPSSTGFVLSIHLEKLGEVNQPVTPQTVEGPYWPTDLDVTPVGGTTNQLYWGLAYGGRTDKELLQKVKAALRNLSEEGSQPIAPRK